jgi:hypothetical protein
MTPEKKEDIAEKAAMGTGAIAGGLICSNFM